MMGKSSKYIISFALAVLCLGSCPKAASAQQYPTQRTSQTYQQPQQRTRQQPQRIRRTPRQYQRLQRVYPRNQQSQSRNQQTSPHRLNQYDTNGYVSGIKFDNISARNFLEVVCKQAGLDYRIEKDYIWISTPERIRSEAIHNLERRFYETKTSASQTLPKVVVHNPAGTRSTGSAYGGGGGFGGGGRGMQGSGGMGGRGGMQGGMGGGMQGGGRGGGFGGGGMGGRGGGGGAEHFSNISQLFTTIDDRLVGEPLAVIPPNMIRPSNTDVALRNRRR